MSDEEKANDPKRGRRWTLAVLLLPFLYVLSVGPARFVINWTATHCPQPLAQFVLNFCLILYAPLNWTAETMPSVFRWLKWYVDLFQ